jgi:hypothetical protein
MRQDARFLLNYVKTHLAFIYFLIAALLISFGFGFVAGVFHFFPYGIIYEAWETVMTLRRYNPTLIQAEPSHLFPARYEEEGVVVYDPERAFPGVTLLTGLWKDEVDWHLGIRLIDLNGNLLHEWKTNPKDVWSQCPHHDYAAGTRFDKTRTYVHGTLLLPDGDVIFNLEYLGLVRMNAHSEVVWKLPYRTHHSVFKDDEEKLWVCGLIWRETRVPEYLGLNPPFIEDMILKVSLDGVVEREISLLKTIYNSGFQHLLFVTRNSYSPDLTHLNDIEVISERIADAFEVFEAGDIMVSLRQINTLFVIDRKTEQIKWFLTYPFIGQHDPDFTEDGYIILFDNFMDKTGSESEHPGSRILLINPSTKEVMTIYGHKESQYFYTEGGGKLQLLPNGNLVITEARAGRVFEAVPDGEVVWSWVIPRWNDQSVAEILEGTRYSSGIAYFISKQEE